MIDIVVRECLARPGTVHVSIWQGTNPKTIAEIFETFGRTPESRHGGIITGAWLVIADDHQYLFVTESEDPYKPTNIYGVSR